MDWLKGELSSLPLAQEISGGHVWTGGLVKEGAVLRGVLII